jgi:lysine-N-methylase
MTSILRTNVVSQFSCLGDKCEDTCCKNWSMQLDEQTHSLYTQQAPGLLASVESAEEAPWIMKKDPATGHCVKLEGGLCGIHRQYGDKFLGDACHFYPRATRALGERTVMTATLSCPEITRLALFGKSPTALGEADVERLPHQLKNYLPESMRANDALAVHEAFLAACDDAAEAETIYARIASVSRSIELIDKKNWVQAVPFYLQSADARLVAAELAANDPFNLLHALAGLIAASKKPMSDRLRQTLREMEKMLGVTLDWNSVWIYTNEHSLPTYQWLQAKWKEGGEKQFQPLLKKYLQMQLSLSLYPFAGFGGTLTERSIIIGVRLATIKLALMSVYGMYGEQVPQEVVVRVVQSISRFLDHLGDPAFSLQIYAETGWNRESRMRGLLTH